MCLKEFQVFTFSNYDAFKRVLKRLEAPKYWTKQISGHITIIKRWKAKQTYPRDDYSYMDLEEMCGQFPLLDFECYYFENWQVFNQIYFTVLKNNDDMFGKVTVEIR